MDRNLDNGNPHLAVKLPEILGKIMTFLPKSDLFTCTTVNAGWEDEARKRLLVQSRFNVKAENVARYQEIITARGNTPRNITVFKDLSLCANIILNNGHKVKRLETHLLHNLDAFSSSFPNLNWVRLQALSEEYNSSDFPQKTAPFSKVRRLAIYAPRTFFDFPETLNTQLVPLFPKLASLWCQTMSQSLVEDFLNFAAPTLTSLTLIDVLLTAPMRPNPGLNLTRLEIGNSVCPGGLPPSLSIILKVSSGTLVNLRFTHVENIDPHVVRSSERCLIFLPILPKLRAFELVQSPFARRTGSENSLVTPAINLRFQGAGNETRLVYPVQFPVLERITVLTCNNPTNNTDRLTEKEYFEAMASFLYNSFLHPSNSASLTVKKLEFPFPDWTEKFKFVDLSEECACGEGPDFRECYEWKDCDEFGDRVMAAFPVVLAEVLESMAAEEEAAKV